MKKILIISICILVLVAACSSKKESKQSLVIFNAGSLTLPIKKISDEFMKKNPGVEIKAESAGSRTCARKVSELNKECDILASADYTVIDNLLIPDFASWNIKFVTNEMVIVFRKDSKRSSEIKPDNWYKILLDKDVSFGRSDPNSDPCGYRSVLVCKLAEKYYNTKGLADSLISKDVNNIRPKETDLLALLESGTIDYLFIYKSIAQQHGLNFITLPDSINLKSASLSDYYKSATVEISGKKPGTKITKRGTPMVYGVTIPKSASNRELAIKFLDFMLSDDGGMKILDEMGQPSALPSISDNIETIPNALRKYVREEK